MRKLLLTPPLAASVRDILFANPSVHLAKGGLD